MTVVEDGDFTQIGTAFAAVVFAATAVVALRERWGILLIAGIVTSFPQAAGLVLQSHATDWVVVGITALSAPSTSRSRPSSSSSPRPGSTR